MLLAVDELLSFVDGILQRMNGKFRHDMQWNALCRAFDLRNCAGDQCAFVSVEFCGYIGSVITFLNETEIFGCM